MASSAGASQVKGVHASQRLQTGAVGARLDSTNANSGERKGIEVRSVDRTIRAVSPDPQQTVIPSVYSPSRIRSLEASPLLSDPVNPAQPRSRLRISSEDQCHDSAVDSLSTRPRTRTMDEVPRRRISPTFTSEHRPRVRSIHSSTFISTAQKGATIQMPSKVHSLSLPSISSIQTSEEVRPSPGKLFRRRHRLVKCPPVSAPASSSPSPASQSEQLGGSLQRPVRVSDANKILELMKTKRGRMRGVIEWKPAEAFEWFSDICFIDDRTGNLVRGKPDAQAETPEIIVPDLGCCYINGLEDSAAPETDSLVLSHASGLRIQLRPIPSAELDSWLAACLCWQSRPASTISTAAKLKQPTPLMGRRQSENRDVSARSSLNEASIIKVGRVMWLHGGGSMLPAATGAQMNNFHHPSHTPLRQWQKVSCVLRESGEFKLCLETGIDVVSVVHLSQLSRYAIQHLDLSVLDREHCIALYPRYAANATLLSLLQTLYLSFDSRVLLEAWLVLLRAFAVPEIYGPALSDSEAASRSPERAILMRRSDMFRVERSLSVRIVEAKLRQVRSETIAGSSSARKSTKKKRKSDRYLSKIFLDGELRGRTSSKPADCDPFWFETFEFAHLPGALPGLSILLVKSDADGMHVNGPTSISGDGYTSAICSSLSLSEDILETSVGKVEIDLEGFGPSEEREAWLPIVDDGKGSSGDMMLRIRAEETVVLMSEEYRQLSDLLHCFSNGLTVTLARALPLSLPRLSQMLLSIFQVSGRAGEWLMELVEEEVDGVPRAVANKRIGGSSRNATKDSDGPGARELIVRDLGRSATVEANLLFRGNSLLTKALELYMSRIGKEYLEETLRTKLKSIEESNLDCEVDPSRLSAGSNLDKNWRNLVNLFRGIWSSILDSALRCPWEIRLILRHVRSCAEDRWGKFQQTVSYSSVSGFIFLRFFCPAVLNPRLFGLLRGNVKKLPALHLVTVTDVHVDQPSPRTQRTLTLVAKSLQGLANMTKFGVKESWMEPMNHFLSSRRQEFKDFVDSICVLGPDPTPITVPPAYATPITILARLPPTSREGFPSLPHLIDAPRELAGLVNLWMEKVATVEAKQGLHGDLLAFHRICVALSRRSSDCLAKAEQTARRASLT